LTIVLHVLIELLVLHAKLDIYYGTHFAIFANTLFTIVSYAQAIIHAHNVNLDM